ncbi:MAG TPA: serine/threonine-protein kinase [Enhygromyxa sp.]|nr:serine/threonine-protein kinase [Enhygromyxa sp.]
MSSEHELDTGPTIARPEPDTLEQRVFAARLEARLLGTEPELPRIDRFVLERMLGAGGMGTVWLARDETLARNVALKLVRGNTAAGERMRLREARGLATIAHPNVITVFDVGEHEGRVWLAMEYVPGRTLRECAGELDREQTLAHWIAAGHGLAAIHAAGLVHRDVKPDNVLLGDDGRVRVIDLGLVRAAVDRSHARTPASGPDPRMSEVVMTPGFVGTRSYAAPEQQRGEGVDARADQYAFCVSLLESLRAAKPTSSASAAEPLPEHLREALARGQRADPEQRFASMAALLAALEPRASPRRLARPARVLALATLALAVLALGGLALRDADPRPTTHEPNAPSPAWSSCMARARPACDGTPSEAIELVLTCATPACDALLVTPSAALLAGERTPFDVDVDNRTPRAVDLRWHSAGDASRSPAPERGPGHRPLPPHWQREDLPICVEIIDARGQANAVAIGHKHDCE